MNQSIDQSVGLYTRQRRQYEENGKTRTHNNMRKKQ